MTPTYFEHPAAAERMAKLLPDAKLVVILRHPVDRAYSHYQMQQAKFTTSNGFTEVIDSELAGGVQAVPQPHHPYLRSGRYYEHLQRLLQYYPRSALLVLLMDDLATDPEGTYKQLCEHIGVASDVLPPNLGRTYNRTRPVRSKMIRRLIVRYQLDRRLPGNTGLLLDYFNREKGGYPELDPAMRRRLLEYYATDTTSLADWMHRDLSHWMR